MRLRDSGDLILAWHESMGDSFAIGAAFGPSLILHQQRIPWNFAAAENFMTRRWAKIVVTMLKGVPVRKTEKGQRSDSTALRLAIKLVQNANEVLFPSGGRYVYGEPEVFDVSPGIGLTVTKARRIFLLAFTGMAGKDPILPYYKSWQDVPVRPWHRLLGRYSDVPRYLTWTVGFKLGRTLEFNCDKPIEAVDLLNEFPLDMPNREQRIADSMMQRIIELRRQILPSQVV